jgi:hypothetical protein
MAYLCVTLFEDLENNEWICLTYINCQSHSLTVYVSILSLIGYHGKQKACHQYLHSP